MSRYAVLPRVPPTFPDTCHCDASYGIDLAADQCTALVNQYLPQGNDQVNWYFHPRKEGDPPRPPNAVQLPIKESTDHCTVEVNSAGPESHSVGYIQAFPSQMRGYAGFLITQCPQLGLGLGGIITKGMDVVARSLADIPDVLPTGTSLETVESLSKSHI